MERETKKNHCWQHMFGVGKFHLRTATRIDIKKDRRRDLYWKGENMCVQRSCMELYNEQILLLKSDKTGAITFSKKSFR